MPQLGWWLPKECSAGCGWCIAPTGVGVFHGCVAQAFLALVSVIALVTSRWWLVLGAPDARRPDPAVLVTYGKRLLTIAILIYLQLRAGCHDAARPRRVIHP